MEKKFSISEAIKFGWGTMKKNFWFFVGLLIIMGIFNLIPNLLPKLLKVKNPDLAIVIIVLGWLLYLLVSLGFIKIVLKFCDSQKGKIKELFSCLPQFLQFLAGLIIYYLLVFLGTILFIIPGIIWAIKYQFFAYLIVDEKLCPTQALKKSGQITKGVKWDLFVFLFLIAVINLLGAIFFGLGLFVTIPTTTLATAFIYRKLRFQTFPPVKFTQAKSTKPSKKTRKKSAE